MLLLSPADFFKIIFFKNSFRNTIRVSNSFVPDQDRRSVGPDLDPKCLQSYQQTTKVASSMVRVEADSAFMLLCMFQAGI